MKKYIFSPFIIMSLLLGVAKAQTDSIDVQHYEINLNIDNIISKGHIGNTTITFDVLSKQYNKVQFDLLNQVVDSVYIGNNSVYTMPYKTNFTYDGKKIAFDIPYDDIWDDYFAIIYYHGASTVENNDYAWGGLHYDNNIIYSMGVAFLDYPHTYAKSWFVCNDSFLDKATYSLNISVDKDREAFCSGQFIEKEEKESFDTYKYEVTQQISPYLVAVTIGKFFTYQKTIHSNTYNYDIPLIVKYINANDLPNIEHNFSGIEQAFNSLEEHFGKFRFNRIGYCITPKGSMEHVDNISLAQGAINDTTIEGVSNIVHELGHSWFGNLVTCKTAEDMWLNEGWTTYTTRLSLQSIYGEEKTKDYWRNKHKWVMEKLPLTEGIRSVTPVDSSLTYSSTVYEKGSMVAKTIQGYFGDEIFFPAVKAMLDSFEFSNYSSYQVRDFLANYTNDDKFIDFFNNLVFEDKQINYDMAVSENGDVSFKFNYPEYDNLLNIPVQKSDYFYCADCNEELMTLNTDNYIELNEDGLYKLSDTYAQIKSTEINIKKKSDDFKQQCNNHAKELSVNWQSVRLTLHWATPYYETLPEGVEKISNQHYWTLKVGEESLYNLQLRLYFELDNSRFSFDSSLVADYMGRDSIILLYRYDYKSDWSAIPFSMPNSNKGYITIEGAKSGDYAFAVGDKKKVSLLNLHENTNDIKIYPNPSDNTINIYCENWENTYVTAYQLDGKAHFPIRLNGENTKFTFKEKGVYILTFKNQEKSVSKKITIQ